MCLISLKSESLYPIRPAVPDKGCNILIDQIPQQGRISIIQNGQECLLEDITRQVQKSLLLQKDDLSARGWLMDILNCVNRIPASQFCLADIYMFETELSAKHPDNHNIKPKIRQQLQVLRDKGFIEFLGNGIYRKGSINA